MLIIMNPNFHIFSIREQKKNTWKYKTWRDSEKVNLGSHVTLT